MAAVSTLTPALSRQREREQDAHAVALLPLPLRGEGAGQDKCSYFNSCLHPNSLDCSPTLYLKMIQMELFPRVIGASVVLGRFKAAAINHYLNLQPNEFGRNKILIS